MKNNKVLRWIPRILTLVIVTLLFVYPFWWMLVNSLNTNAQVFGQPRLLPQGWKFENYVEIFQKQPFALHYFNTILVAVIGTLGNVFISALSGYGFSRIHFPGRNALFILLLTALMMPIEVIIIPLFYEMKSFNLTDSLIPLMLIPIFCSQGAISAFMFRQFFVTVPKELERTESLRHFPLCDVPDFHARGLVRRHSRVSGHMEHVSGAACLHDQHHQIHPTALSEQFQRRIRSAGMAPPAGGNHAERRSRHGRLPDFPGKGDRCDGQFRHEGINDEHSFS